MLSTQDLRPQLAVQSACATYDQLWHFAYSQTMKATGPEFGFVGSLKLQTAGERVVYLLAFHDVRDFFKKQMPAATIPSLMNVQNFFQEASKERATLLAESAALFRAVVKAGQALYVPCGFIQCEMTAGAQDVVGYRWMVAPPTGEGLANSAFKAMHETMKPGVGVKAAPNLALLIATHAAMCPAQPDA